MIEDARTERLAEAIDRIVLGSGEAGDAEEDIGSLLALAADLHRALPVVPADATFQSSLRARLLSQPRRVSLREQVRGLSQLVAGPRSWRYAAGGLAAALALVAAANLTLGGLSPRPFAPAQALSQVPEASAPVAMLAVPETASGAVAPEAAGGGSAESPQIAAMALPSTAAVAASKQPALPILPPLSASVPHLVGSGLGGGYEGGDAGQEPQRQIQFEIGTQLPNLGPTATVYRYRLSDLSEELVQSLATKLEIGAPQLRSIEVAGEVAAYIVSGSDGAGLEVQRAGGIINYSAGAPGPLGPTQTPSSPPDDTEALRAATQWLEKLQLMPMGAGTPQVERPYPDAPFKVVTFRPADPSEIITTYPVARVSIGAETSVKNLHLAWPEVESTLTYPAQAVEAAWEMVKSGRAEMHFQDEHASPDFHGTVRITSVQLSHAMTFGLDDRPYLQPVVLFTGESVPAGTTQSRPFSAQVPLVADDTPPAERVSYQLLGALPEAPAEAVALQQAEAQPWTIEKVRDLGKKLGLTGEPHLVGKEASPGALPYWEMSDPGGQWVLQLQAGTEPQGGWEELWNLSRPGEGRRDDSGSGKAPTGENAIRIADEFLESRGFNRAELGPARVAQDSFDGRTSLVIFGGSVEGLPLYDAGILSVSLDARGEVRRVASHQHPVKVVKRGKILTPQQALEAIEAGGGSIEVRSLINRTIYSDRAEIEKVQLAYRVRVQEGGPASAGPPSLRWEPYYLFSGTIEVGESRKRLPFTTSILAWAP